jgi:hypothetical protein
MRLELPDGERLELSWDGRVILATVPAATPSNTSATSTYVSTR